MRVFVCLVLFAQCAEAQARGKLKAPFIQNVPIIRQSTNYSCGAAAMMSALGYFGLDFVERDLIRLLGTTPDDGTAIESMERFARKQGLTATVRTGLTVDDLVPALKDKQIVIVDAQAWGNPSVSYETAWEDGHYMIVLGIDDDTMYFMDPALTGGYGYLRTVDFILRWHDVSTSGKKWLQTALFIKGEPGRNSAWQKID